MVIERDRDQMIRDIEAGIAMTASRTGRGRFADRVMAAMRAVPREEFVPANLRHAAFRDGALPVGHGQTISQPYIVALMTDLLDLDGDETVLEIGTGTGYQAAVLSRLAERVYSVERIAELAASARERLARLGYANVEVRAGDGYAGWPEHAPYDAIIVTAAAPRIPQALIEQLGPDGRLLLPLGSRGGHQELVLVTRDASGEIARHDLLGVAFVPLVEAP